MGLIVDEVVELLPLPAEAMHQPDPVISSAQFIFASLHVEDRLIVALDLDRLWADSKSLTLPG
jgi:chemotaxis signal transduction protein